ncbi:kinase-like domain-containing protein [Mycena epipterygia]|nr:kinase-like domain-containing protein [Mycena epipterygia]
MSLETALDVILEITPVPGLSAAFTVLKLIVSSVQKVSESKRQLEALATAVAQLLGTLDAELRATRLVESLCSKPLKDLNRLLKDIQQFVQKEQDRGFFKSLLTKDSRISTIEGFYRRIATTANAFQISALVNIQSMLANDDRACRQDTDSLNARLRMLERNQAELQRTLDVNQRNILAMMVSMERKLAGHRMQDSPEHAFYGHALQYLIATSGQQVRVEDWMITPFEIEYISEVGVGGFGKVYRGTWNKTEVAIKVVRNVAGISPRAEILRREIKIWSTLRHPNIVQFLGANTLDEWPFVVMSYIPHTARQFLRKRPDFNPAYLLLDISLGLEYLHSRQICHGDLKGVNVLVDDSRKALLCDFGLARVKADVNSRTAQLGDAVIIGSRNWMAPELLAGSPPMTRSDIYAFGMTAYELYTDEDPFSTLTPGDFLELVCRLGMRPNRPNADAAPWLTDAMWALAENCWDQDPHARPTAARIHDIISHVISEARNTKSRTPRKAAGAMIPELRIIQPIPPINPMNVNLNVPGNSFNTKSRVLRLTSARHRICFCPLPDAVPLNSSTILGPVVCELGEGLVPLCIGRPDGPVDNVLGTIVSGAPIGPHDAKIRSFEKALSRRHAEMYVAPGGHFFVRDVGSRFGTFLNGSRLSDAHEYSALRELKDGDIVQLGSGSNGRALMGRVEIGPRAQNMAVDLQGPPQVPCSPEMEANQNFGPEPNRPWTGASTLVQFMDLSSTPSFGSLLCRIVDGAPPIPIMRWSPEDTSLGIIFEFSTVSRRHAILWSENGRLYIQDTNSLNGTFVNGVRVIRKNIEVKCGDVLRLQGAVDNHRTEGGITAKMQVLRIASS